MKIPIYQIDAFTDTLFKGNPAAVCFLDDWPDSRVMQSIAAENNLSETAFCVPRDGHYDLRWFTPQVEIDLCGHATLAAGYAIMRYMNTTLKTVEFDTRSGRLTVARQNDLLALDFPARPADPCDPPPALLEGLGLAPEAVFLSRDYLAVFDTEAAIRNLTPNFQLLAQLDVTGIIVTAPGGQADFVSRFFAPRVGVPEDPVTGSAHCTLVPYWAERLGKTNLTAAQLSKRGGALYCENAGNRVSIAGRAVTFLEGAIHL